MTLVNQLVALVALALPIASVACTIGEERHETVYYEAPQALQAVTCSSPFTKPDTSKLTACGYEGRGKGHCYPPAKAGISPENAKEFPHPNCTNGDICLADEVFEANGTKLKSCTFSVKGAGKRPGVCMNLLGTQLNANKDLFDIDTACKDDERCAPCIDPRDGTTDLHVCDPLGVHEEACTFDKGNAKAPQLCCHGMGQCLNLDGIPEDNRSNMKKDVCKDDKQVCAPNSLVNGKPVKCDVLGASGVCVDVCFATELTALQRPGQSSCGPTEICIPCLIGKGQGLPGCE